MCIIAIKKKGLPMFDEGQIRTMFSRNPDGAGMCYEADGKVHVEKGFMDVESLIRFLRENDLKDRNVILHFRIGTSGRRDSGNCHPFPVFQENSISADCELAMAHNGVLNGYYPGYASDINDTQFFIELVLSKMSKDFLEDSDKVLLIKEIIGSSRLAFLDGRGRITTMGRFIEDGGYLYSNESYKTYSYSQKTCSSGRREKAEPVELDLFWEPEVEEEHYPTREALLRRISHLICLDDGLYYDDKYYYTVDDDELVIYKERAA